MTQKCDLVCGLSVEASLMYAASLSLGNKVAHYVKVARVKQVSSPAANRSPVFSSGQPIGAQCLAEASQ